MNWSKPQRYYQPSECQRFNVVKVHTEEGWRYEPWRTGAHPEGRKRLGVWLKTPEEARKVCEDQA